jgi:hypothetical protein
LYKKNNNNNKVEKNDEEEHQENEEEELREFEKLEKYTEEHPSFRSSISYVDAFLQRRRTSTDRRLSIDSNATIQSQTLIEEGEEEEEHNYGGECSPPKGPREQLAYVEQLINKIKNNPGLVACDVDTLRSEFMNMMLNEAGHKDNNPRMASSSSLSAANNNNIHSSSSSPNSSSSSTSSTSSPDAADYSFNSSGMFYVF